MRGDPIPRDGAIASVWKKKLAQYETLNVSRDGGLMWIAFNRPKVLNAFNLAQWQDLKAALDDAEIEIPFPYVTHTFKETVPVSHLGDTSHPTP